MGKTVVNEHLTVVRTPEGDLERPPVRALDGATVEPPGPPPQRVGLSPLDRLAASAFANGDRASVDALLALVRDGVEVLVGPDADGARFRLLAREIQAAKVALDLLTASVGDRVKSGDLQGARALDKLAIGAARRLVVLLEQHRHESAARAGRSPVVAVGVAQQILVGPSR